MDFEVNKKVEIVRYNALIKLRDYLKHNALPKDIYVFDNRKIEWHCKLITKINKDELLVQTVTGEHEVIDIKYCYVDVQCIIFKDIEDYTMYQPELNFAD